MSAKKPASNTKSQSKQPQKAISGEAPDIEPLNRYVCERIKTLRRRNGWTLEQLAASSGVSRSMLSQVERGAANPTLAVAFRIAKAFDVSLADLVEGAMSRPKLEIIRADDETAIFRDDEKCRIRTLSPLNLEKDVEFYEVQLFPGQSLESAAHFSGTREFLTVQKGTICVTSGEETATLRKGDSVQYSADVNHSIKNDGKSQAVIFLVDIYTRESV